MVFHGGGGAVDLEIEPVDIAPLLTVAKIEIGAVINQQLFAESRFIVTISVGPAMEPDETQRIGGVVGVGYFFEAVERMTGVGEGYVDMVIDLLLPIGL